MKKLLTTIVLLIGMVLLSALSFGCKKEEVCEHKNCESLTIEPTCDQMGLIEYHCVDCGEVVKSEQIDAKGHSWGEWVETEAPTYFYSGTEVRECLVCHKTEERDVEYTGCDHVWGPLTPNAGSECLTVVDGYRACEVCGEKVMETTFFLKHKYVDGYCCYCHKKAPVDSGLQVTMGTYPQSKVTDEALLETLNALVLGLPEEGQASTNGWTSYGYYLNGKTSHFMWYMDVEVGGEKYRAVYYVTKRISHSFFGLDDAQPSYDAEVVHWFKWEPITWTVIEEYDDSMVLMSNVVIDAQIYDTKYYLDVRNITLFEESYICKWLNETFLNAAFTKEEQERILPSEHIVLYQTDQEYGSSIREKFTSKIYLYDDITKLGGGTYTVIDDEGTAREYRSRNAKYATDYAHAQGARREYDYIAKLDNISSWMTCVFPSDVDGTLYEFVGGSMFIDLHPQDDVSGVVPFLVIFK